jgi:hypothetical protein
MNVDVVALEAKNLEGAAVGQDEGSEDVSADALDLLLYAIIHVGVRSIGWRVAAREAVGRGECKTARTMDSKTSERGHRGGRSVCGGL